MNAPLDIEPILDRWLGAGDDVLPDRVLDAALAQVGRAAQRRPAFPALPRWVTWRSHPMLTLPRLLLGLAAIALIIAGAVAIGSQRGPTPSVTTPPAPSGPAALALSQTFTSTEHGYAVRMPASAKLSAASEAWLPRVENTGPDTDRIDIPGTDSTFVGGSAAIQQGSTWDSWLAAYHTLAVRSVGDGCAGGDPSTWTQIAIGSETGLVYDLCNGLEEAVAHVGTRVYVFTLENATLIAAQHADRATFRAMLATVTFDPATAVATPWDATAWQAATSKVFGVTMRFPFDWTVALGTTPWRPGTDQDPLIGTVDLGKAPLATPTLTATNQVIPTGQTYEQWVAAYRQPVVDQFGASCFPAQSAWEPVTIDGRAGGLYVGCAYIEAQVLVDRRVYVFTLYDGVRLGRPPSEMGADRDLFDAFLSSITLDPASAKD